MEDISHTCSSNWSRLPSSDCFYVFNILKHKKFERLKYLLICLLISQLAHFPHRLVLFTTVLALLPSLLGGAGVGWAEGPKNFIKLEMSSVSSDWDSDLVLGYFSFFLESGPGFLVSQDVGPT